MTEELTKKLNIYQRLNEAMKIIGPIEKDGINPAMKYGYVTHDQVTKIIRKALIEVGIKAIPTEDEYLREGNSTTLKVRIKYVNIDDPNDFVEVISWGEGVDTQDKGIGKALSYAIKMGYMKMFGLACGLDNESDSIERTNVNQPKKVKSITKVNSSEIERNNKIKFIMKESTDKGNIEKLTAYLTSKGLKTIYEAPTELVESIYNHLK